MTCEKRPSLNPAKSEPIVGKAECEFAAKSPRFFQNQKVGAFSDSLSWQYKLDRFAGNVVFEDEFAAKRALLSMGIREAGSANEALPAPWYAGKPFERGDIRLPISLRIACTADIKPEEGVLSRHLWVRGGSRGRRGGRGGQRTWGQGREGMHPYWGNVLLRSVCLSRMRMCLSHQRFVGFELRSLSFVSLGLTTS
jgi:hypothetical protein